MAILYTVSSVVHFSVLSFCKFPFSSCQVEKTTWYKNSPLEMGAIGIREPDEREAAFELALDPLSP